LIRIFKIDDRIENSQFPNLDYNKFPFFKVPDYTHHSMFKGGTLSVGTHPVVALGHGVEFKIMDIRVEATAERYPRERKLVWFFTIPNLVYLQNKNRAIEEAKSDFWNAISDIALSRTNDIFSRTLPREIVGIFLESLGRLRSEYHSLITLADIEEQRLQNFLENHFFLLDPSKSFTKKKRSVGKYLCDFYLEYDDGTIKLVEIQVNHDSIIEKDHLSQGFKEALLQLKEWFSWLEENDIDTFSHCEGMIIIGRKQDRTKNQIEINKALSSLARPSVLLTYDDLEDAFEPISTQLEKMKLQ
jgi:hypothetical protein